MNMNVRELSVGDIIYIPSLQELAVINKCSKNEFYSISCKGVTRSMYILEDKDIQPVEVEPFLIYLIDKGTLPGFKKPLYISLIQDDKRLTYQAGVVNVYQKRIVDDFDTQFKGDKEKIEYELIYRRPAKYLHEFQHAILDNQINIKINYETIENFSKC